MFLTTTLSAGELENLVAPCAVCHGAEGVSSSEQWPNLAGQQVDYLIAEMTAFRDGTRVDPLMSINLKNFTDKQIVETAQYFSALPASQQVSGTINEAGRNVRAHCISCHGMTGNTVTSAWPNLAGQKAAYLKKQLMDFKSGARKAPIMEVIAKELTDQQIADVAQYFSQI